MTIEREDVARAVERFRTREQIRMSHQAKQIIKAAKDITEAQANGAAWILALRAELGLSQRALATAIGMSFVHLCNVERGHADPLGVLVRINERIEAVRKAVKVKA